MPSLTDVYAWFPQHRADSRYVGLVDLRSRVPIMMDEATLRNTLRDFEDAVRSPRYEDAAPYAATCVTLGVAATREYMTLSDTSGAIVLTAYSCFGAVFLGITLYKLLRALLSRPDRRLTAANLAQRLAQSERTRQRDMRSLV